MIDPSDSSPGKFIIVILDFICLITVVVVSVLSYRNIIAGEWTRGLLCLIPGVLTLPVLYFGADIIPDLFHPSSVDTDEAFLFIKYFYLFGGTYVIFIITTLIVLFVNAVFPAAIKIVLFIISVFSGLLLFFLFAFPIKDLFDLIRGEKDPNYIYSTSRWLDSLLFKKGQRRWKKMMKKVETQYNRKLHQRALFSATPPIALVVGNGFELDLGYQTSYECFAKSEFWPFHGNNDCSTLGGFLNTRVKNGWYDLESGLYEYAINSVYSDAAKDDFNSLRQGLTDFINHTPKTPLYRSQNCAMSLLHTLIYTEKACEVFSFNYMDFGTALGMSRNAFRRSAGLRESANSVHKPQSFEITHVHGLASSHNIIIGTRDFQKTDLKQIDSEKEKWSFLCKAFHYDYSSSQITKRLGSFETVIIFGHSLSFNAFPYFRELFKGIMDGTVACKNLILYTRDALSASKIDNNLTLLEEEINLMDLKNKCNYVVVHTDVPLSVNDNHWYVVLSLFGARRPKGEGLISVR